MSGFFTSPWAPVLAAVFLLGFVTFQILGWRWFRFGLANPDHPRQTLYVVNGFRGWIVSLACLGFAGGLWFAVTWPLVVGAVFLGEELLETGIMVLALRSQAARDEAVDPAATPAIADLS